MKTKQNMPNSDHSPAGKKTFFCSCAGLELTTLLHEFDRRSRVDSSARACVNEAVGSSAQILKTCLIKIDSELLRKVAIDSPAF